MEEKKIKTINTWAWNIIMIWFIIAAFIVWEDAKTNPQLYGLVEERPTAQEIGPGQEWMLEASTFSECKPVVQYMQVYNKYFKPIIYFMVLMVVFSPIARNWKRIKEGLDRAANER